MTNSTMANIENHLNKLFVSLDSKFVRTSFILSKLNLSYLIKETPKKSLFNPEAFLKLYLYKRIKLIRRYLNILEQLQYDLQHLI